MLLQSSCTAVFSVSVIVGRIHPKDGGIMAHWRWDLGLCIPSRNPLHGNSTKCQCPVFYDH
jgi:hypothetical protein